MADDLSFAKQGLAHWARSNGIYQIRDALAQATVMAGEASSGEELASLILAAPAPEAPVKAPVAAASPAPTAAPSKESAKPRTVKK